MLQILVTEHLKMEPNGNIISLLPNRRDNDYSVTKREVFTGKISNRGLAVLTDQ